MNTRRSLFSLVYLSACLLVLSACSFSSSALSTSIAVSFSTAPPTSANVGVSFSVTAVVSNDSSNAGVNWTASCQSANCGSFNPTHTSSGGSTVYTAPPSIPAGSSVTLLGASAADSTKAASGNVTINPGGAVSVTFNAPAPPPTLTLDAAAGVAVTINSTVMNAVSAGVDWSATCTGATNGCGTFSASHTGSGMSTNYTAPPTVPTGGLAVTVKASSTFDPASAVSAVISVSGTTTAAFLCADCTYTYSVAGTDAGGPFALAGVFQADGLGNITGGEQDFSDLTFSTENSPVTILAGKYSFGSDGRGTISLTLSNVGIGVNGVETFGVAFVSANHMLITELDPSATASGSMDLQTLGSFSPSTLSGGYAFVSGGASLPTVSIPSPQPLGYGGVFNVNSPGTISGMGSTCDANFGGNVSQLQALTGSYPAPDAMGRVQITLHPNFIGSLQLGLTGPVVLAVYINDAKHLNFVEVDSNFGVTSGIAVGQGSATGTLGSASVLPANSSYVFTTFGTGVLGPIALATTYTSDGVSKLLNGSSDVNSGGVPSSGSISGLYGVDAAGTGRVDVTLSGDTGNLNHFAIYLSGGQDPGMVLELDKNGVTSGAAFLQAAGSFTLSSFQGPYGLNFSLFNPTATIEVDVSGQVFADGAGNLLGTLDINDFGTPVPNQALTGSYASSASGRFTGSVSFSTTSGPTTLQVSYFLVSPSLVVFIETDSGNAVSLGLFQVQTPPF